MGVIPAFVNALYVGSARMDVSDSRNGEGMARESRGPGRGMGRDWSSWRRESSDGIFPTIFFMMLSCFCLISSWLIVWKIMG